MSEASQRSDEEDLEAIRAIRSGDESGLLALMERYREPVFRFAYRYVGNATDAQTLAEESFAKVFFNASKFKPSGSVKSWIFTIVANHCRDFLRREKRRRATQSLSHPPSDDGPAIEETLSDSRRNAAETALQEERLQEIQAAIQSLPEKLRFPFVFCVLEERPQEEAAAVLGTSRKTIELRIYRARKILQSLLGRDSSSRAKKFEG